MPTTQQDAITRYLEDAIAAERGMASQLGSLAADGDDEEVRILLTEAAGQAQSRADFLTSKLNGDGPGGLKTVAAHVLTSLHRVAQAGHIQEERIVQSLIGGYSISMATSGMYQGLHAAAEQAGDLGTAQFAEGAIDANHTQAEKLFHLIPSRAIIAYNMLTISEIDPSVDTKYGESDWTG